MVGTSVTVANSLAEGPSRMEGGDLDAFGQSTTNKQTKNSTYPVTTNCESGAVWITLALGLKTQPWITRRKGGGWPGKVGQGPPCPVQFTSVLKPLTAAHSLCFSCLMTAFGRLGNP